MDQKRKPLVINLIKQPKGYKLRENPVSNTNQNQEIFNNTQIPPKKDEKEKKAEKKTHQNVY